MFYPFFLKYFFVGIYILNKKYKINKSVNLKIVELQTKTRLISNKWNRMVSPGWTVTLGIFISSILWKISSFLKFNKFQPVVLGATMHTPIESETTIRNWCQGSFRFWLDVWKGCEKPKNIPNKMERKIIKDFQK